MSLTDSFCPLESRQLKCFSCKGQYAHIALHANQHALTPPQRCCILLLASSSIASRFHARQTLPKCTEGSPYQEHPPAQPLQMQTVAGLLCGTLTVSACAPRSRIWCLPAAGLHTTGPRYLYPEQRCSHPSERFGAWSAVSWNQNKAICQLGLPLQAGPPELEHAGEKRQVMYCWGQILDGLNLMAWARQSFQHPPLPGSCFTTWTFTVLKWPVRGWLTVSAFQFLETALQALKPIMGAAWAPCEGESLLLSQGEDASPICQAVQPCASIPTSALSV